MVLQIWGRVGTREKTFPTKVRPKNFGFCIYIITDNGVRLNGDYSPKQNGQIYYKA